MTEFEAKLLESLAEISRTLGYIATQLANIKEQGG